MTRFQGDPKISITPNGATLTYKGGQPVMDGGLENFVQISLFTRQGWWGNDLLTDSRQKIGADIQEISERAITVTTINDLEKAIRTTLKTDIFGRVSVEVTNPKSTRLEAKITIEPPGQDAQELFLARNGGNWIVQANDPAYLRT